MKYSRIDAMQSLENEVARLKAIEDNQNKALEDVKAQLQTTEQEKAKAEEARAIAEGELKAFLDQRKAEADLFM